MSANARSLDLLTIPLEGTHLIEASAGTGKTYAIASLYLRMLLERPRTVQQILVVTFTKAATAELRGRIRERIQAALGLLERASDAMKTADTESEPDEFLLRLLTRHPNDSATQQRLRDALICMDEAAIFTIHGLCQGLLQEYAFESGVLFDSEVIGEQRDLLAAVIRDFWRTTFYPASPGLARLAYQTWGTPERLLNEVKPQLAREDVLLMPSIAASDVAPAAYRRYLTRVRHLWPGKRSEILAGLQALVDGRALRCAEGHYRSDALDSAGAALDAYLGSGVDDYFLPPGFELFTREKFEGSLTKQGTGRAVVPPVAEFFEACQQVLDVCRHKVVQLRAAALDYCRKTLVELKTSRRLLSYDDLIQRLEQALRGENGEALARRIAAQFPATFIDEFQDTDPGQYAIFRRLYRDRADCALFMIGDPKQAIYGFRGGDIFTYMQARRATASQYTLDASWRSTSAYLRAVNTLFRQERQPFVYSQDIPYVEIHAAPESRANRERLTIGGEAPAPFSIWLLRRTPDNTWQKTVRKEWAREAIAVACAGEVARLLDARHDIRIGGRIVEPKDIAILVRTHWEARVIHSALQQHGIPSVYLGRQSIYGSMEAVELGKILAAIVEPQSDRALRAALATDILGKTAEWLAAEDDERWDEMFQAFRAYHEEWERHGFIAMFRRLLHEQGVPERLMQYLDGERRLTNLLQLGELLQAASQERQGMAGLLRWFADARREPDDDNDDQQLRLESDAERVQIVTIHKSKGLEYELVFLPYCWDSKPRTANGPFTFHDEGRPEMPLIFDLAGDKDNLPQADKERMAEELRLLYVAATRARYRCYLAWGNINGAQRSALGYLLHGTPAMSDPLRESAERMAAATDEELFADLEALNSGEVLFELTQLPVVSRVPTRPTAPATGVLAAREFCGTIDASWRIASFTAWSSALGTVDPLHLAEPDHDLTTAGQDLVTANTIAPDSALAFPKGAGAGIFLHELFESLDFPAADGPQLAKTAARLLRKHGYAVDSLLPAVTTLVRQVLDTVLDSDSGLCLGNLDRARRLNELKFYYPIAAVRAAGLNDLLREFDQYTDDPPNVEFDETRGMMLGFIDLVFEHGGRYYLADYKSNYLGSDIQDYARNRLPPVMRAHRYDLQYLIYTVAVHRYLRHRLPGYSYGQHFGGVYYLFLRGMAPQRGAECGVFRDKPDQSLIERLDALFATGSPLFAG